MEYLRRRDDQSGGYSVFPLEDAAIVEPEPAVETARDNGTPSVESSTMSHHKDDDQQTALLARRRESNKKKRGITGSVYISKSIEPQRSAGQTGENENSTIVNGGIYEATRSTAHVQHQQPAQDTRSVNATLEASMKQQEEEIDITDAVRGAGDRPPLGFLARIAKASPLLHSKTVAESYADKNTIEEEADQYPSGDAALEKYEAFRQTKDISLASQTKRYQKSIKGRNA